MAIKTILLKNLVLYRGGNNVYEFIFDCPYCNQTHKTFISKKYVDKGWEKCFWCPVVPIEKKSVVIIKTRVSILDVILKKENDNQISR